MNKTKLILPLFVVAPTIFACNSGVAGNYKVQEATAITHKFIKGDEQSFATSGFIQLGEIKTNIYGTLTKYYDGSITPDKAVHLSNEMGVAVQTAHEGSITIYPVNLRETGESSMDMPFQYGKTSSGYHFLGSYMQGYDNLEIYRHISFESGTRKEELVVDNGFEVKGNTLTANFIGRFLTDKSGESALDYQIDFTVTATK